MINQTINKFIFEFLLFVFVTTGISNASTTDFSSVYFVFKCEFLIDSCLTEYFFFLWRFHPINFGRPILSFIKMSFLLLQLIIRILFLAIFFLIQYLFLTFPLIQKQQLLISLFRRVNFIKISLLTAFGCQIWIMFGTGFALYFVISPNIKICISLIDI